MRKDKNTDDVFREKLRNYEQEPPAYMLDRILDGVAEARRKKRLIWLRVSGIAAGLILAFVAGWQLNNRELTLNKMQVSEEQAQTINQSRMMKSPDPTNTEPVIAGDLKVSGNNAALNHSYANKKANSKALVVAKTSVHETEGMNLRVPEDQNELLQAMKSLQSLIKTPENNSLHPFEIKHAESESSLKSVDQQIMELNKQTILAENGKTKKARWSLGAQVSPEYNGSNSSHTIAYASNMLKTKSSLADMGGGISVEYKKGKRWSLQSGVYYSGIGQASGNKSNGLSYANDGANYFNTIVKVESSSSRFTMNSNAGVVELDRIPDGMVLGASLGDKNLLASAVVVSQTTFVQDFDYIEVPLFLKYTIVDRKFGIGMMGGLSSNILVGNRLYAEGTSGKTLVGRTKDLETLNYSGTIGMGFRYEITNHIAINVEPRFKYFINSLSSNSAVRYRPYTFGVFTGLSYDF